MFTNVPIYKNKHITIIVLYYYNIVYVEKRVLKNACIKSNQIDRRLYCHCV